MSLPPEILKYIISDYIEYPQLQELISYIPELYVNPKRVKIEETFYWNKNLKARTTNIDDDLEIEESFYENGDILSLVNYRNDLLHGKLYKWYDTGNIEFKEYYKDDRKNGMQYYWYQDGNLETEKYYVNGNLKIQNFWYSNGKIDFKLEVGSRYEKYNTSGELICCQIFEYGEWRKINP